MKKKVTTDKALIASVTILIIYTIITEIQIFMGKIPDSTLTVSIFAAFSLEGGFCAYLHGVKKKAEQDLEKKAESWDL